MDKSAMMFQGAIFPECYSQDVDPKGIEYTWKIPQNWERVFLYRLLNMTMPDPRLYEFLVNSFRLLDRMESGVADFHIPFLVSLLSFSGIQPDVSHYHEGWVFELASGTFVPENEANAPIIKGSEAKAIPFISRINFSNMKSLRLTGVNRRQILYGLLNYYSYHFPGLGSLKSPEILREIFD